MRKCEKYRPYTAESVQWRKNQQQMPQKGAMRQNGALFWLRLFLGAAR